MQMSMLGLRPYISELRQQICKSAYWAQTVSSPDSYANRRIGPRLYRYGPQPIVMQMSVLASRPYRYRTSADTYADERVCAYDGIGIGSRPIVMQITVLGCDSIDTGALPVQISEIDRIHLGSPPIVMKFIMFGLMIVEIYADERVGLMTVQISFLIRINADHRVGLTTIYISELHRYLYR